MYRRRRPKPEAESVSSPTLLAATDGPTAAEISRSKSKRARDWVARAALVEGQNASAECYRQFALQLRPVIERLRSPLLLVTSALRLEGKTTTACNLALALASMADHRRIALLDLDLHRPGVARGLGLEAAVGFERVLAGESSLESARIPTDLDSLDVFLVAKARPMAHELLSHRRVSSLFSSLAESYDAVIIDSPPVLLVPDVALVAPYTGGSLAVVRAGFTYRSAFREMLGLLPREHLVGCFLNDARLSRHARRYSSYYGSGDDTD